MPPTVATVTPWKAQVAPMAWRGRIYWHRTGQGVVSEGWSSLSDGTDDHLETGSVAYPFGTNQSIEDVSSDGRYALVTVERADPSAPRADAAPGSGVNNDLWLTDLQNGSTWRLVDLLATGGTALIWPRFNPAGTKVVWAEKWAWWTGPLSSWDLHVADIAWTAGVPTLTNKRVRRSDGFVEPYAFVDNDTAVLASCDKIVNAGIAQIASVPVDPTKAARRLSPSAASEWIGWLAYLVGMTPNYCEFAYPMPAFPDRVMFGRTWQADNGSVEFWTMKRDGTDVQRLTWLSKPGHPQYVAPKVILGGIAWDPDNPLRFVAGYGTDTNNNMRAVIVELAASG
jgi:hypothetical protein